MQATKYNLQIRLGMTRSEAVTYHKEVGNHETEVDVEKANAIKSKRAARQQPKKPKKTEKTAA